MTAAATAPAAPTEEETARAERFVAEIVQRHFGELPEEVTHRGGGLTNLVYQFKLSRGKFIVRTHHDATKITDYLKEQWAMNAARDAGVPVPDVLEVANFPDGRAYMISEQVPGVSGEHAPRRLEVVKDLGHAAAALHKVRTRGYGPVFDWSNNRLSHHARWADYLLSGFNIDKRLGDLVRHGVLDESRAARLRDTAAEMARWRRSGVLHHGDLRLKNAIVDPDTGRLAALIDWETCTSQPGPYWDLSLALHDLGPDEKEAFLAGYGMKAREFEAGLPYMRLFNVLNYAPAVSKAAKDKEKLEWFRLRLKGALSLYEQ